MAPPSPAMNPDTAKATSRAWPSEMPIDCAASSLPRSACSVCPTVPCRSWITASDVRTRTISDSTRNARSSAKSNGPSTGRGTRVPGEERVPAADPGELHHHGIEEVGERQRGDGDPDAADAAHREATAARPRPPRSHAPISAAASTERS